MTRELVERAVVEVDAFGLPVRPEGASSVGPFVPVESEPAHIVELLRLDPGTNARRVDVLDPEHERAGVRTR